jgi:UDP-N-acetyl-2-amino-2-deoxyglucuronate dehydrogenase
MNPLRIGIAGYGYTGRIHAHAYMACAGARLVAVCDSDTARLADLPEGVRAYSSYAQMLEGAVDAVSICLPTHLHARSAIAALTSGKHVLVEKPIAANLDEADSMLKAAKDAGRTLYVGMTHRFYPELREAKELVDAGEIGTIIACNDSILEHIGLLDLPGWYLTKDCAGGGTALTSGIHLIDRIRWFTGEDVALVAGSAGNPSLGADVEDTAQMFLRFRTGKSAQITMAFLREPHPLVCDLQVIGTLGSISVHTWRGYEVWNGSGHRERVIYTDEPHRAKVLVGVLGEVREFCDSIASGRPPWPTAEESTRALAVVMAFYQAAATGGCVEPGGRIAV